ncbi:MAG: RNA-binding protein [Methyloligellaceae bacterium]
MAREQTIRQCAATRERRPVEELLRFVIDPDGRVVPDLKRRLPGRGVWLTASSDVVASAVRQRLFARAFRQAVEVDAALPDLVAGLLAKAALGSLSLANKAGVVILGFDAVDRAISAGGVLALVHALDAAEDGCRKLDGKYLRRLADSEARPVVVRSLNADELSLALGRPNVVHAAVTDSGASANFVAAAERLERFRADSAAFAVA